MSDQELNRMAAKHILKCESDRHCNDLWSWGKRVLWTGGFRPQNDRYVSFLPASSWDGAGIIVDEMEKKGFKMTLQTGIKECKVVFTREMEMFQVISGRPPLAITMAALKALEVKGIEDDRRNPNDRIL